MENSLPSEINEEAAMLLRTPEIQKLFKSYDKSTLSRKTMPTKFQSQGSSLINSSKLIRKIL